MPCVVLIGADEGRVPTGNSNAEGVEHQSPASRSARWVHGHPKCLVPRTGFHTTPGSDVKPLAGYCCMVATDTQGALRDLGLVVEPRCGSPIGGSAKPRVSLRLPGRRWRCAVCRARLRLRFCGGSRRFFERPIAVHRFVWLVLRW